MTAQTKALNIAIDYMNERLEDHDAKYKRHPATEAERINILADIETVKEALAQPEHSCPECVFGVCHCKPLAQPEQILGFDVVIDESMPPNTFKLAQPEQKPVAWLDVEGNGIPVPVYIAPPQPKEPEREPVAWGIIASNTGRICQVELDADEVEGHNPKHIVPLYTTQPQRKPLSNEEIAKIASTPAAVVGSYVHTFARAIEAAHGIKE